MAFNIQWHTPQRVIYAHIWGQSSAEEAQQVAQRFQTLLDETTSGPVHLIIENSQLENIPTNLKGMKETLVYLAHPHIGWVVGVAKPNPAVQFMEQFLIQNFKLRFHHADTLDEALHFLRLQDRSLND